MPVAPEPAVELAPVSQLPPDEPVLFAGQVLSCTGTTPQPNTLSLKHPSQVRHLRVSAGYTETTVQVAVRRHPSSEPLVALQLQTLFVALQVLDYAWCMPAGAGIRSEARLA